MKKVLPAFIIFSFLLCFLSGTVVYANSAAPTRSDNGRGIIFEKHDKVKIVNEVLDIAFGAGQTAKVTAKYNMKNITDESLSVGNMFLYPIGGQVSKEIKVLRNGIELAFDVDYFGNEVDDIYYNDDWQALLSQNNYNSRLFGDGGGFIEYTVNPTLNVFEFVPTDYYFAENFSCVSAEGVDHLYLSQYRPDGKIITKQTLELDEDKYTAVEIDDIYEYLLSYCKNAHGYDYDLLAKTAYKSLLYGIEKDGEKLASNQSLYFNDLTIRGDYYDSYLVGAILYDVDFAPNETLELTVQYDYKLGSNSSNSYRQFKYYLTPAKYWQDFGGIEINLYLNKEHPVLGTTTVEFEKIDKLHYRYVADKLPEEELIVTVSKTKFKIFQRNAVYFLMYLWPFVVILLLIIVLIVIIIVRKKKRKHTTKYTKPD